MPRTLQPIAVSCGEPAGIGPELVVAAARKLQGKIPFFWIGDARHLPQDTPVFKISTPADAHHAPKGHLAVLDHPFPGTTTPGTPDPKDAAHVIAVIEQAVDLVRSGAASALCTLPIHKKALKDGAQFRFPGHTEFLAHLAGTDDVVMCLASPQLRVVPATIHIPLAEVPRQLTPDLLEKVIRTTKAGVERDFGIKAPRIAVAGLNPHAGEGGAMGSEEGLWMSALVHRLCAEGMDIRGPLPADTMFHQSARRSYDVAICAYHDQALIPIKTLAFDQGVNVTLGLPFIRTSPDHGTAFDIAGKGLAKSDSFIAALILAAKMARQRRSSGQVKPTV